ncbi:MAG: class I SAM-dependent methyltransferase family protein [Deinococcota bacterium]
MPDPNTLPSYDSLAQPLPATSLKGMYYRFVRWLLASAGSLSDGIRLGQTHGFDSGVMLEYVYTNQASGRWGIGALIDRIYLNSPGWQGIRARRELIKTTLREVLSEKQAAGEDVHLLDVACGGGRYDLEVLRDFPQVKATLRDYQQVNVDKAQELAQTFGVTATIEQADAFSDSDLAAVSPAPNVVVVSGLHEILADDALIENHFSQLANIIMPGGTLIFTVQPYHPQLELIARTLKSHTGNLWVMRLRSLEQVQSWAGAAGFQQFEVSMEPQGIFGVVRATHSGA